MRDADRIGGFHLIVWFAYANYNWSYYWFCKFL